MRKYKELWIIGFGILVLLGFVFMMKINAPESIGAPVRTEFQVLLDKVNTGTPLTIKEYEKFIELYNKEIQKAEEKGEKFIVNQAKLDGKDILRKTSEKLE